MPIIYTVWQGNINYQLSNEKPRLFTEIYISNINDNGQRGHMLEVDLQYLKSLHHYHKYHPLCPERKLIKTATSSNF